MTIAKSKLAILIGFMATSASMAPLSHAQTGTTESGSTSAVSGTMHEPEAREPFYPRDLDVDAEAETEQQAPNDADVTTREVVRGREEELAARPGVTEEALEDGEGLEENAVTAIDSGEEEDNAEISEIKEQSEQTWKDTKSAFKSGWVEGKLESALMLNDQLESSDIKVKVEGGQAILEGEVPSEVEKELAEEIAAGIEGVESVKNDLTINKELSSQKQAQRGEDDTQRDFAQYFSDVSTTAAIKTRLLANDEIAGMDINVDTFQDRVTLSGKVDNEQQKRLAESIAKERDGVSDVVNDLEIQS